jgi:hypothetical protein
VLLRPRLLHQAHHQPLLLRQVMRRLPQQQVVVMPLQLHQLQCQRMEDLRLLLRLLQQQLLLHQHLLLMMVMMVIRLLRRRRLLQLTKKTTDYYQLYLQIFFF